MSSSSDVLRSISTLKSVYRRKVELFRLAVFWTVVLTIYIFSPCENYVGNTVDLVIISLIFVIMLVNVYYSYFLVPKKLIMKNIDISQENLELLGISGEEASLVRRQHQMLQSSSSSSSFSNVAAAGGGGGGGGRASTPSSTLNLPKGPALLAAAAAGGGAGQQQQQTSSAYMGSSSAYRSPMLGGASPSGRSSRTNSGGSIGSRGRRSPARESPQYNPYNYGTSFVVSSSSSASASSPGGSASASNSPSEYSWSNLQKTKKLQRSASPKGPFAGISTFNSGIAGGGGGIAIDYIRANTESRGRTPIITTDGKRLKSRFSHDYSDSVFDFQEKANMLKELMFGEWA